MLRVVLTLILVLTFISESQAREIKGATPRKKRHVKLLDVDIEDLVRAEDDPNFEEFLKEREHQHQIDQASIELHKKQRQEFEDETEKKRRDFIDARSKKVPVNMTELYQDYKRHLEEKRNWRREQAAGRAKQVADHEAQVHQIQASRQVRLEKVFPNQRLPASIEEPKYPKKTEGAFKKAPAKTP